MPTAAALQEELGSLAMDAAVETGIEDRPRDAHGRFVSAETVLDSPPDAPPDTAAAAPTDGTPAPTGAPDTPEPVAEAAPDVATEGATEAVEPPVTVEDWKYVTNRHEKTLEIVIPGAKYAKAPSPDKAHEFGVLIPDTEEAQKAFYSAMNLAALYPEVKQKYQDLRAQFQTGVTRHQVENVAMAEQLKRLLDPQFHAEALGLQVGDLPPQYLVQLERVQVALEKKQAELLRAVGPQMVDAGQQNAPEAWLVEELNETFDDIVARGATRLSAADQQALEQDIEQFVTSFVGRGRNGERIVLADRMERYITDWIKARGAASPPVTTATAVPAPKPVATPAARNAAAAKDRVVTPPSAGGPAKNLAAPPPQKPKRGDGAFTSTQDAAEYWR